MPARNKAATKTYHENSDAVASRINSINGTSSFVNNPIKKVVAGRRVIS